MTRRSRMLPAALALAVALALPAAASASSASNQIIGECANESLSKQYTQQQYQEALDNLPSDLREYTDCYGVISAAKRAQSISGTKAGPRAATGGVGSTGGGTGGPPGAAPATTGTTGGAPVATPAGSTPAADPAGTTAAPAAGVPAAAPAAPASNAAADQAALAAAQKSGAGAVEIGGTTLNPGDPAGVAVSLDDLPTPMLVLLGLFALVALLGLAALVKSWVLSIGRSRDATGPR